MHSMLERGWKILSWGLRKWCFRLLFFLPFFFPFLLVQEGKWEGSMFCSVFIEKTLLRPTSVFRGLTKQVVPMASAHR